MKGIFIHLANELATKSVDDTSNRRCATLANEVEVEHALHGSGLHTVYEASRLVVEESVSERREHSAGGFEASDVVIGVESAIGGSGKRSR
jgi:putative heme iron utilization protein